jgi:hypothetical protein
VRAERSIAVLVMTLPLSLTALPVLLQPQAAEHSSRAAKPAPLGSPASQISPLTLSMQLPSQRARQPQVPTLPKPPTLGRTPLRTLFQERGIS